MAKITKERDDLKKEVSFIIIFFRKIEKTQKNNRKGGGSKRRIIQRFRKIESERKKRKAHIYFLY